jgi:DNA helicase INO80
VQRVVISGGAGAQVDFNTRSRENRTKDIAMWLADDDQAAEIEKKEAEMAEAEKNAPQGKKRNKKKKVEASLDEMYHEGKSHSCSKTLDPVTNNTIGEGHFDESAKPSGTATPIPAAAEDQPPGKRKKGMSKKAKTAKQRLAVADGQV